MQNMILKELEAHQATTNLVKKLIQTIEKAANLVISTLQNGNKVLICGNGGSAADAQHFAAELTGRYKSERQGLPAIALTTDTSALTAIGNDYGYEIIFSRQTQALGRAGDLLIGLSTSGNSKNVLKAFEMAEKIGIKALGFSGRDGGMMKDMELNLIIPSNDTARIQEMHIFIIHTICQAVDDAFRMQ